jgi:hypothetical protein
MAQALPTDLEQTDQVRPVAARTPTHPRLTTALGLLALTVLAVLIHGYHYGIEDEAIYLPAIKKILDPSLYPRGSEFFMSQARGTALPWIIAGATRLTRVPLPWVVITAQFVSVYVFLLGCWMIAARFFQRAREQWAAVALVTALLTLPISGTSIYLVDQHLHPRTLACAFVLIAIAYSLERRALATLVACVCATVLHPLMALYGIAFVATLWLPLERWTMWRRAFGTSALRQMNGTTLFAAFVAVPFLARPTEAWRQALATREYYTLRNWDWYEWLGLLGPIVIVWWITRLCERRELTNAGRLMYRLTLYAVVMAVATMAITLPHSTEFLWPLQIGRYLHTVYLLMILIAGGLLARKRAWISLGLSVALGAVMCFVQFDQFDANGGHHIDFPGLKSRNAYMQAFLWARDHTPKDSYFALDPEYMDGSDHYGFRAVAERSQMADVSKDAAVVTVSPTLASEWKREVDALRGWDKFTGADFARLRRDFGVDWVVVTAKRGNLPPGMECPYLPTSTFLTGLHDRAATVNRAAVCRTPGAPLRPSGASN